MYLFHLDALGQTLLSLEDVLRTIDDRRDLVINGLHSVINGMRNLQNLRSGHSSLLLRQLVQPLQCILDVGPPDKLLEIFF